MEKAPAPPSTQDIRTRVLGGFQGNVPQIPVGPLYHAGLAVVAFAMILLPVIYVGLIGLAAWAVRWHAVEHTGLLKAGRIGFFIYIAPLIGGGIMVLFMIKPIFAGRPKRERPLKLKPENEPLLFDFVRRICLAVGAPVPREIHVDSDVNASAGFRHGIWSMAGSDLVLTIGLPLAAGLTPRQFAGVLAHEFGHFAQGAGMRLSFVVRSINSWFARVVYERDAWDAHLSAWTGELGALVLLAHLFLWVSRRILWCLMIAGHAISCFLLRQMEFDADRYEAWLAGSDCFEATMRRITALGASHQIALGRLSDAWAEGRLADNLPAMVNATFQGLSPDVLKKIDKHIAETETGLMQTHPADKDRIANARRLGQPGLFQPGPLGANGAEGSAAMLFSNFAELAKLATLRFYKANLGEKVQKENLFPTEELMGRHNVQEQGQKATQRFMQGTASPLFALPLPNPLPPAGPDAARQLADLRARWMERMPQMRESFRRYDRSDTHTVHLLQAKALLSAKVSFDPKVFKLPFADLGNVNEKRRLENEDRQRLEPDLRAFFDLTAQRMAAALALLAAAPPDNPERARLAADAARALPPFAALCPLLPELLKLRDTNAALLALVQHLEGQEQNQDLIRILRLEMGNAHRAMIDVFNRLGEMAYPFEHAKGPITLRMHALEKLPDAENLGEVLDAGHRLLDRVYSVHFRLLGQLALAAEAGERLAGLEPLPEPPPEPDEDEEKGAGAA